MGTGAERIDRSVTLPTGRRRRQRLLSAGSVLAGIVVWHVVAQFTHPFFLVGPLDTIAALGEVVWSGEYGWHLWLSAQEFVYGFTLAVALAIPLGLAMAVWRDVETVLDPWVSILYSTPRLALGPLVVLWFGIGVSSKVALVFLGAVFPVLVNTYVGAKNVDAQMQLAAHAFGASRWEQFRTILVPGALPHIISGLRLGAIQGILGVLVGEFFGSRGGVGNMIFSSAQTFETAKMFVGIATFAVAGLGVSVALRRLEQWYAPWRQPAMD